MLKLKHKKMHLNEASQFRVFVHFILALRGNSKILIKQIHLGHQNKVKIRYL